MHTLSTPGRICLWIRCRTGRTFFQRECAFRGRSLESMTFSQMVTVRSCLVPVTTDVESFGTACRLSLFSFQKNGNIKLIFHWCVTSNHKCRWKRTILVNNLRRVSYLEEKIYKTMSSTGAANLAIGICVLVGGIVSGILLIVNGARLLKHKGKIMF